MQTNTSTYERRHHAGEEVLAGVWKCFSAELCEDRATDGHRLLVSVGLQEALGKRHLQINTT